MLVLEAMQLAEAYGISEDAVTEFIPLGTGDSRNIRTWGRIDRARRSHTLAGTPAVWGIITRRYEGCGRGGRGARRGVADCGDHRCNDGGEDESRESVPGSPRTDRSIATMWDLCSPELVVPYRKSGVHPECAFEPRDSAR